MGESRFRRGDGTTHRYRKGDGSELSVNTEESYILHVQGDTCLVVDKTSGGVHKMNFATQAERDAALHELSGDHPVWDLDSDVQINRAAENYGKTSEEIRRGRKG